MSGQLRERVRTRLRSWSLRTSELTITQMADLLDELRSPAPLSIAGDWFSATCRAEIGADGPVPGDTGHFVLDFRLIEIGGPVGPIFPDDPADQNELEQELAALDSGLTVAQNEITGISTNITRLLDRTQGTVSVTEPPFNATGNGVTDDRAAVQLAIDTLSAAGGGEIYFPPGHYVFSDRIYLRPFVRLVGAGRNTILENISTGSNFDRRLFFCGNYGAGGTFGTSSQTPMDGLAFDVAAGSLAGENAITLLNAGDASNFQVGDIVFLFNGDVVKATVHAARQFQQINKVAAINGAVITLHHPLYKDFAGTSPQIVIDRLSGVSVGTEPSYVAERVTVSNFLLRGNTQVGANGRWVHAGGGYQCLFEDLWLENVVNFVGAQLMAYCTFRNLTGTFASQVLVAAYLGHDNIIDGVNATSSGTATDPNNFVLHFHENCHGIEMRDIKIDVGDSADYGKVIHFDQAAANCLVDGLRVRGSGTAMDDVILFGFTESGIANNPKGGNTVRNADIFLPDFGDAGTVQQIRVNEAFPLERKAVANVVEDSTFITSDASLASRFLQTSQGGSDYEFRRIVSNRIGATIFGGFSPATPFSVANNLGVRLYEVRATADRFTTQLQASGGGKNNATPLVHVGDVFHANDGTPTTITQFNGGYVGKLITIQDLSGNLTIEHGTNIFLKGGANKTLAVNETIRFAQFQPARWDEV